MDIVRERKKLINNYKLMTVAGVVIALIIVVFVFSSAMGVPKIDRTSIVVELVKKGGFAREIRGPGILVSEEFRVLAASVPARIERIILKPGDLVTEETVIIELSSPDLLEKTANAEWDVANQEHELIALRARLLNDRLKLDSDFAALQADYENASAQLRAETPLAARGVVSKLQIQKSKSRLVGLEKQVKIATNRLKQFEISVEDQLKAQAARVKYLRDKYNRRLEQVANLKVRSGIDGVLQRVSVEEGQRVSVGTNLARVANPNKLAAELSISETQAEDIRRGQAVRIDTHSGIIEGFVQRIDPAVEGGTVQIDVALKGSIPASARLDLSVDGTIEIEQVSETLFIGRPVDAKANSSISLFVIDSKNDEAVRRTIQLGRLSNTNVEIVSGLVVGERVILSGLSELRTHNLIKIR